MAIAALIGGTLAAGGGLLALMTWLESSLEASLAPEPTRHPAPAPASLDAAPRSLPAKIAA